MYALTHLLFAGLGGALVGLTVGAAGHLLPSAPRMTLAVAGTLFAVYVAVRPRSTPAMGFRRQVARRLERRVRPAWAYAIWGAELGSGLSTLIPYPAFLVLLSIELLAGPLVAAAAGASFGLMREGAAILAAQGDTSPARIMALLPRLAQRARLANLVFCLASSVTIFAGAVR